MTLFLFTNFFPTKRSEPFLVNEYNFTGRYFDAIHILPLYGELSSSFIEKSPHTTVHQPLLASPASKRKLFLRGILNFSGFKFHAKEFFSKQIYRSVDKMYWFFVSLLIVRLTLSSKSYKNLVRQINSSAEPVLYFYWADNLCWILPYLRKSIINNKTRVVIRLHGTDLYENLKSNYAPLRDVIFSYADFIVPVSKNGEDYLRNRYPSIENKLFLSRLGVFDNGLNAHSHNVVKQIVSVSNLVSIKRVHLIFEALQHSQLKIRWHHFGDGPEMENIRKRIADKRQGLDVV
jgi:glycosyltransferase involved in cell wall biosynthesis